MRRWTRAGCSALGSDVDDDWLDIADERLPLPPIDTETPADATLPGLPVTSMDVAKVEEAKLRHAKLVVAWESLSESQRIFLNTWRECRFNANRAFRVLSGVKGVSKSSVSNWRGNESFNLIREMLRDVSIEEILSKSYLAARQEDIVETLLTPKPILHQGFATGHFEVEAGAAGKANEVLLRLGGHLKDRELDVNVGIVGPSFCIQVVQPDSTVIDVTPCGVAVELPAPSDDWLE